jgi:hypothetical protein
MAEVPEAQMKAEYQKSAEQTKAAIAKQDREAKYMMDVAGKPIPSTGPDPRLAEVDALTEQSELYAEEAQEKRDMEHEEAEERKEQEQEAAEVRAEGAEEQAEAAAEGE